MARKQKGVGRSVRITAREMEVLRLLAIGFTTEQIGKKLKISGHTASCHRCNVIKALGVRSSQQAVARALQLGLVTADFVIKAAAGQ